MTDEPEPAWAVAWHRSLERQRALFEAERLRAKGYDPVEVPPGELNTILERKQTAHYATKATKAPGGSQDE